MAINVNKAFLVGHLGADPEIKGVHGDVVTLRVATSESWKDKQGERQERTQWHTVVVFAEATAKYLAEYAHKGDMVCVEGQIETRKWERGPNDNVYFTEIMVKPYIGSVQILAKQPREEREEQPSYSREKAKTEEPKRSPGRRSDNLDDEIPF